jgi:hypothetical protein
MNVTALRICLMIPWRRYLGYCSLAEYQMKAVTMGCEANHRQWTWNSTSSSVSAPDASISVPINLTMYDGRYFQYALCLLTNWCRRCESQIISVLSVLFFLPEGFSFQIPTAYSHICLWKHRVWKLIFMSIRGFSAIGLVYLIFSGRCIPHIAANVGLKAFML